MLKVFLVTYNSYQGLIHRKFATEREVNTLFETPDEVQWIMDALGIPASAFDAMTIQEDNLVATYIS